MKSQETIIRMKPEVKARFVHFFKDPEEAEYAVRFAEERALAFWDVYTKWRASIFAPVPQGASVNGFSVNVMFDISDFEIEESRNAKP